MASDVIYTAHRYTVPAHDYVDIFEIELPETFSTLTAHLTMPSNAAMPDYLDADNVAYAVRDRSGAGRVLLVTDDNLFLEQIFRSLRGVELYRLIRPMSCPPKTTICIVFDGVLPLDLPDGDLLLVNPPVSGPFFTIGESRQPTGPITANPDDPRTRNLTGFVEAVNIAEFPGAQRDRLGNGAGAGGWLSAGRRWARSITGRWRSCPLTRAIRTPIWCCNPPGRS